MGHLPAPPRYPALVQINTRVWLTDLSRSLGRTSTLDDIPDAALDKLAAQGFDWVWLLTVWQTGPAGQRISRTQPEWRRGFEQILPDLTDDDICGSGFAIVGYTVHRQFGGDAALARLRARLGQRGLRLMLDFVPNHTALDHPWVDEHPEYYIHGSETDLAQAPQNYTRVASRGQELVLAYGRDPNFAGWPDTLQLDYSNPRVQEAMTGELLKIAAQCDGVRCDMAMLLLPEVFARTWGRTPAPFWPQAIEGVRHAYPGFRFMAEVYWNLEWELQQQGFDTTYDKRLYDRLRSGQAQPVREHLVAGLDFQQKLARFLENHDEARAAAVFPPEMHEAAAVVTYLTPGLRFFQQGQCEGHRAHVSPHLCRAPDEPIDARLADFYRRLLTVLSRPIVREGDWHLLECLPAWEGNWTHDCFLAFAWEALDGERLLVVVNYAAHQSQCYVRLPWSDLAGSRWQLQDLLGADIYQRDGDDLAARGLYLDQQPWQNQVFRCVRRQ